MVKNIRVFAIAGAVAAWGGLAFSLALGLLGPDSAGDVMERVGEPTEAHEAMRTIERDYEVPFLAHAICAILVCQPPPISTIVRGLRVRIMV